MPTAEQLARIEIDRSFIAAGWFVQKLRQADAHAARGVALREFQLDPVLGFDGHHAGKIINMGREEFGKCNEFARRSSTAPGAKHPTASSLASGSAIRHHY